MALDYPGRVWAVLRWLNSLAYSGSQLTGSALDIKYLSTPTLKPFLESQAPLHSPLISDDEVSDHKASNALSILGNRQSRLPSWRVKGISYPYVASPQESLSWPNEHASSVGHDSKFPPGMGCFGPSGERFFYLYRVKIMLWIVYNGCWTWYQYWHRGNHLCWCQREHGCCKENIPWCKIL